MVQQARIAALNCSVLQGEIRECEQDADVDIDIIEVETRTATGENDV